MGDRIGMIEQACNALTSRGIIVKRTSNLWETEPMYVLDQDNFINGACEVSKMQFGVFAVRAASRGLNDPLYENI